MKRVNVIGTTGSGKTTFAGRLAKRLGYPCIQMDQLYWKRHWAEPTEEEFFPKLTAALSGETWVLDGNYNRTNSIKWKRVDTIIWLDFGFLRTLLQLTRRTIRRASTREELWPGTENRESFSKSFLSKDSILVWFFRCYGKNRGRYGALMRSAGYEHIEMIRLRSPSAAQDFLNHACKKPMPRNAP